MNYIHYIWNTQHTPQNIYIAKSHENRLYRYWKKYSLKPVMYSTISILKLIQTEYVPTKMIYIGKLFQNITNIKMFKFR